MCKRIIYKEEILYPGREGDPITSGGRGLSSLRMGGGGSYLTTVGLLFKKGGSYLTTVGILFKKRAHI